MHAPHDAEIVERLIQQIPLLSQKSDDRYGRFKYDRQGRLRVLDLNNLSLPSVFPELSQLSHLQKLLLDYNLLAHLPAELSQLSQLQELDLECNQLTHLPVEVAQLSQLQRLALSYNQLTHLPAELSQLSQLQELSLEGNSSLKSPPPEIVSRGTEAVLTYLRNLMERE